jgi:SET domain
MNPEIWLALAMSFNLLGYASYWRGIRNDLVRPNRSSWLIWSAVTTAEALTYQAVNPGLLQNLVFFVSASSCLFVTFAIWRQSIIQSPSRIDWFCMAITVVALLIWWIFQEKLVAHLVMVAAVPISFIPTWVSAAKDPSREANPAWGLWTLGDLATLIIILSTTNNHGADLPYIVMELGCHASVWLMIGLTSIFRFRQGDGPSTTTGDAGRSGERFQVIDGPHGKGVVAKKSFPPGALLLPFTGPRFQASEVVGDKQGERDRLMQIDRDLYLGPSGGLDDLINHSCDPNAGLRFFDETIQLVALRDIQPNEEVRWDYSTTLHNSDFFLNCACGAKTCRGVISNFSFLEPALQQHYRDLDVIAPYLRTLDGTGELELMPLAAE